MKEDNILINAKKHPVLVCFDFDKTIVKDHFHYHLGNSLCSEISWQDGIIANDEVAEKNPNYNANRVEQITNTLLERPGSGIRDSNELKNTFEHITSKGGKIAITSYSKFPDAIKVTLKSLGLSDKQMKDIDIIVGFPSEGANDSNGKMEHINKAKELAGMNQGEEDNARIILVDDGLQNIEAAKRHHISAIQVGEGFAWSKVREEFDEKLKQLQQDGKLHQQDSELREEINKSRKIFRKHTVIKDQPEAEEMRAKYQEGRFNKAVKGRKESLEESESEDVLSPRQDRASSSHPIKKESSPPSPPAKPHKKGTSSPSI